VTADDRRLAALAALFAPARAAALLGRRSSGADEVAALAGRLAAIDRRARLEEASLALAPQEESRAPEASEEIALRERRRVAGVLRSLATGVAVPPEVSPALVRLCRERLGR
jgi:hypothetical protein